MKPKVNESIFRPNDIRGIYGKDLTDDIAEKIGKGFGTLLGERKNVVVGRDVRLSSKSLRNSLIRGLTSTGCNVVDIGIVTTPAFYFSLYFYKFDGGIMITASHNPPEWNGFHIYKGIKSLIVGEGMDKLKEKIEKEEFRKAKIMGKVKKLNILKDYMGFISSKIKIKKKLKIAVDCSNGCAALIIPKLLEKLRQRAVVLNAKTDGKFPAHGPNVEEENLKELKKVVKETKADFGVCYDGDADRAAFVDEKGRAMSGDKVAVIILEKIFKKKNCPKILDEVSCSSVLEKYIRSKATLKTSRRGHAFLQQMMRKENIDFGFEKSSHFYFQELNGFDDAVFATLKVAEVLSESGKSFSQIVDSITWPPSKEEALNCKDEIKLKVVENVKKEIHKLGFKTNELDGIKAFTENGWFLIRASITEPVIRIVVEAKDKKTLKEILSFARKLVKKEINICLDKVN
ncbi:MAG: phosphomannomutase/phosphoglucomutase [Candidatus Aenigmatarchaeota archaeon]